jgi:hypothetical protein
MIAFSSDTPAGIERDVYLYEIRVINCEASTREGRTSPSYHDGDFEGIGERDKMITSY